MNILIVENEIYLAQKVAGRLFEEGHHCDTVTSYHEVNHNMSYDAVLLSTNLPTSVCDEVLKKYQESIIILLVSYISDATVTRPIKMGADDYVLKPFVIDELIRKIQIFQQHRKISSQNRLFSRYFEYLFDGIYYPPAIVPTELPFVIQTNESKISDKIVLDFAIKKNKQVKFIDCTKGDFIAQIEAAKDDLVYLTNIQILKKAGRDNLITLIKTKNVILQTSEALVDCQINQIILNIEKETKPTDQIMTINDYVKLMIANFQGVYPDTELSKKLGISRKSLWEKRKKLEVVKKK